MRSGTILGLALLAAVAAGSSLRAEDAQQAPPATPQTDAQKAAPTTTGSIEGCDVPDNLLATDSVLQKVTDAVKDGKPFPEKTK